MKSSFLRFATAQIRCNIDSTELNNFSIIKNHILKQIEE